MISSIPEMNLRMDRLDNEAFENKIIISKIRGDLLLNEEYMQKLESKIDGKFRNTDSKIVYVVNFIIHFSRAKHPY